MKAIRIFAPLVILLALLVPVQKAAAYTAGCTLVPGPTHTYSSCLTDWTPSTFVSHLPFDSSKGPIGLVWDSQSRLWVADQANGWIYRYGMNGGDAALGGKLVYVGDGFAGTPAPNATCNSIWHPHALNFTKSGRLYLMLNCVGAVGSSGEVSGMVELNAETGQPIRWVLAPGTFHWPLGFATDSASGDVFVADRDSIFRIDLSGYELTGATPAVKLYAVIGGWDGIDALTFAPDGNLFLEWNSYMVKIPGPAIAGGVTNPNAYATASTVEPVKIGKNVGGLDGIALYANPSNPSDIQYYVGNSNSGDIVKTWYNPATGWEQAVGTDNGTRGDFVTVGPDHCLYATQTDEVERVALPTCGLAPQQVVPYLHCAPVTGTALAGNPQTFTASFDNVSNPNGINIGFTVTGANAQSGSATTASNQAKFTYTGQFTGTDNVVATATINGRQVVSNPCSFSWTQNPSYTPPVHPTTIDTATGTGEYRDTGSVSAILRDRTTGAGIPGQPLSFKLTDQYASGGVQTCTGITDATGKATCTVTPDMPIGPVYTQSAQYPVSVSYSQTTAYLGSTGSGYYTEAREETSVQFVTSPPSSSTTTNPLTLKPTVYYQVDSTNTINVRAQVAEDTSPGSLIYQNLATRTLTFTLSGGRTGSCTSGPLDQTGTAGCTLHADGTGTGTITVTFNDGDIYYKPSTNTAQVLVYGRGGGDFVIGDITYDRVMEPSFGPSLNGYQSMPNDVYWWGSQWWKAKDNITDNNLLSKDNFPHPQINTGDAQFKGYSNDPTKPWCGMNWTSRPGNSDPPPSSVPDYMAIIVSDRADKNAPTQYGTVQRIVIVKTNNHQKGDNDFYASDPGHAGHGPIVATLCTVPGTYNPGRATVSFTDAPLLHGG